MAVKPAKDSVRCDIPGPLHGTKGQRSLASADLVVVFGIALQNLAQMSFVHDDEVIEALAPH